MLRNYTETMVGISVAIITLLFFIGVSMKDTFTSNTVEYKAVFFNADGVHIGSKVYIAGINIGRVTKMDLDNKRVSILISVLKKYMIPVDSSLDIASFGMLESKSLVVTAGFDEGMMKDGDTFASVSNSVDVIGLLNDYLKYKVSQKEADSK